MRRRKRGGVVAGAEKALAHLAEEWCSKEQGKGERVEKDRCQLKWEKK